MASQTGTETEIIFNRPYITDVPNKLLPPAPPQRNVFWSHYETYLDGWYPELCAICISAACLIAIAAMLAHFDRQFAPYLAYGLTLNAIISILATMSRALLIFAVSNAIGQFKWVWYNSTLTKPLSAAGILDNASRGPLGAAQVLMTRFCISPVALGAIVTLLALATDPFMQQIIVFSPELQYRNSSAAVMTQARFFRPQQYSIDKVSHTLKKYASSMVASDLWGFDLDHRPDCPDGNCLWKNYRSLAWCAQCSRNQAWSMQGNCTLPLPSETPFKKPSNLCVAYTDSQILKFDITVWETKQQDIDVLYPISSLTSPTFSAGDVSRRTLPDDLSNLDAPLIMLSLVEWNIQPNLSLTTTSIDCALDICTQQGQLNMTNGQLYLDRLSRESTVKSIQYVNGSIPLICFAPVDKDTFDVTALQPVPGDLPREEMYVAINGDLIFCLQSYDRYYLTGAVEGLLGSRYARASFGNPGGDGPSLANATWPPGFFDMPLWNNSFQMANSKVAYNYEGWLAGIHDINSSANYAQVLDKGVENLAANLTAVMTKMMHDPNINTNGTVNISGMSGTPAAVIKVRWAWFTLSGTIWLLGLVFIVVTMYRTKQTETPLWKSSVNALLYHGLDYDMKLDGNLTTISAMDRQALQSKVRLSASSTRRRLLETEFMTPSLELQERRKRHWNTNTQIYAGQESRNFSHIHSGSSEALIRLRDVSPQSMLSIPDPP